MILPREGMATSNHDPSSEGAKNYSVSVNIICIVGAIIGIVSLFMPWVWMGEGGLRTDYDSVYDSLLAPQEGDDGWWGNSFTASQIIFISGTVLAFAIPAACGVQMMGIMAFYLEHLKRDPWFAYDYGLSLGFFTAVISTVAVAASLIGPMGIGFDANPGRWFSRTWTAYRVSVGYDRKAVQSLASPADVLRALGANKKWAVALVATTVFLSAVPHLSGERDDDGFVEYIDGQIVITLGSSATGSSWAWKTLNVSDGSESVEWVMSYDEFASGEWTISALEAKNLGELSIAPDVVDYGGEWIMTHGDRMILSPLNGSSFVIDIEYQVAIRDTFRFLDMPRWNLYVTFELVDNSVQYEFDSVETQGGGAGDHPFYVFAYLAVIVFVVLSMIIYSRVVEELRRGRDN